ncbi:MAG: hypothetical protein U0Y10_26310 [Spirosomataceae bacterium]
MKYYIILMLYILSNGACWAQQRMFKTPNFTIHFEQTAVPANTDPRYVSLQPTHLTDTIPYYIQDMGLYLQKSLNTYDSLHLISKRKIRLYGPQYPTSNVDKSQFNIDTSLVTIEIYVEDLGTADGETPPLSNYVKLSTYVKPENGMSAGLALQKACAHELLHHVSKGHYEVLINAVAPTRWWWESLATQADRVVFPMSPPFEAEQYASTSLSTILQNAWDDCNQEPYWYTSGGFLSYLIYYRSGTKASFKEIFLRPSKEKTSLVRTTLNQYVIEQLGAKSIGWEYHNYLLWCYEHKGFAQLGFDSTGANQQQLSAKHVKAVLLNDTFKADTIAVTIPYMAAKIVRVVNQEIKPKTIVIKNISASASAEVYVYKNTTTQRTQLKVLAAGDSLIVSYQDKKQWFDVVVINTSHTESTTPRLIVAAAVLAEGDYLGNIDFADDNTKMKEKYSITISNLHIVIDANNRASGSVEFHMEYAKDGMLALGTDFQGAVDLYGHFVCKGRVKETNYPKCKTGCCTYELLKQNSPCLKVSKYLYWHVEGTVRLTPAKKEIEGVIIVSTSAQKNRGDKSTLKFAVHTLNP